MEIDFLNSFGVGSNLDTKSLVQALVDAEIAPKQSGLERKVAKAELEISGLAKLKSAMQNLQTACSNLNDTRDFNFSAISNSNNNALSATLNGSDVSYGSQNIIVSQLAKPTIMTSDSIFDKTASLDANNEIFSFTVDGSQSSINLDADDSLEDLAAKINDADNGVTARIVSVDGSSYKLFLQSKNPGVANSIVVNNDFLNIGFNEVQNAQDAVVSYNGVSITRSSNLIADLIPGVTLSLKNVSVDAASIEVTRDDAAAADAIKNLVASFNEFNSLVNDLTSVGDQTSEAGAFASDPTVRDILNQAKDLFIDEGSTAGSNIKRMMDLGVMVDRYGVYQVDDNLLNNALSNHFDEIKKYFSADTNDQSIYGVANRGFAGDLIKQMDDYLGFNGFIKSRESINKNSVDDLSEAQDKLSEKQTALEERYTAQFTTMNKIMSEMNSLKDYLDNQLNNMPFTSNNK